MIHKNKEIQEKVNKMRLLFIKFPLHGDEASACFDESACNSTASYGCKLLQKPDPMLPLVCVHFYHTYLPFCLSIYLLSSQTETVVVCQFYFLVEQNSARMLTRVGIAEVHKTDIYYFANVIRYIRTYI